MLTTTRSYCVFDSTGTTIYGWRNGANKPGPPAYWYAMKGVAKGLPAPGDRGLAGWDFADLNGDKRDDLVYVNSKGAVKTWINQRGYA